MIGTSASPWRRRTVTRSCWCRRPSRSTGDQEEHAVRHVKDFTPVAFIARTPLLITASKKLPVKSARELFDLARSKPGQITYASAGLGSINQISTELIALSAGVRFMHVPYKGGAPALNDLVGGHVDIFVSSLPQALPSPRAARPRPLP